MGNGVATYRQNARRVAATATPSTLDTVGFVAKAEIAPLFLLRGALEMRADGRRARRCSFHGLLLLAVTLAVISPRVTGKAVADDAYAHTPDEHPKGDAETTHAHKRINAKAGWTAQWRPGAIALAVTPEGHGWPAHTAGANEEGEESYRRRRSLQESEEEGEESTSEGEGGDKEGAREARAARRQERRARRRSGRGRGRGGSGGVSAAKADSKDVKADTSKPFVNTNFNEDGTVPVDALTPNRLTAPKYCYEGVSGQPVKPTTAKVKNPPSMKTLQMMAKILARERHCFWLDRDCAFSEHGLATKGNHVGRPWWKKYAPTASEDEVRDNLPLLRNNSLGTCAVVGNADNVLAHNNGAEIDRHDFVVRYNTVTKGYEKYVGKKVDGIFIKANYAQGPFKGSQRPSKLHVIPKAPPKNLGRMPDGKMSVIYGPDVATWREDATAIYETYKKERKLKAGKPTGGWARLMGLIEQVANGSCSRLDVYGFSSGGGKYFQRRYEVKDAHVINIEHLSHRILMATGVKGKVCIYGD